MPQQIDIPAALMPREISGLPYEESQFGTPITFCQKGIAIVFDFVLPLLLLGVGAAFSVLSVIRLQRGMDADPTEFVYFGFVAVAALTTGVYFSLQLWNKRPYLVQVFVNGFTRVQGRAFVYCTWEEVAEVRYRPVLWQEITQYLSTAASAMGSPGPG